MSRESWLGKTVTYITGSGRKYDAVVFHVPGCCLPEGSDKPVVSLGFKDNKGKTIRLDHVLPYEASVTGRRCWKVKVVFEE